ncbi:MAG: hypothetical protein N4A49_02030 [Marinifilaceae bacterium]|jgi:Leucine-rich repeat (LRR) protein|nr:hypothetical protein [Marinifilaceae bacterium]
MKLDKAQPNKYFEYIKTNEDFPQAYLEEIFLIAKISSDQKIKDEAKTILNKIANQDVLKAFKNRSKFDLTSGPKARDKNLLILFKMAKVCKTLKFGKMYKLLEDDDRIYIYDGLKFKEEIPNEIGCFEGIKNITINDYHMQTLPHTIGEITDLNELEIRGYQFQALPESISKLKQLKQLRIESPKINTIPNWISECESLEEIEIGGYSSRSYANYKELPILKNLKNLKTLRLSTIDIEHIKDDFFDIPSLEELELINIINLKEIPSSISKLTNLKRLVIANCKDLCSIPSQTIELKKLDTIKISSIPCIKEIDGRILFMPTIQNLIYSNMDANINIDQIKETKIERINIKEPELLAQFFSFSHIFTNLKELDITDIKGVNQIPESVGNLKQLKKISIHRTDINTLPKSIGNLNNLEEIDFRDSLEYIPNEFSKLNKLKHIYFGSAKLEFSFESLPESIDKLTIGAKSINMKHDHNLNIRNLTLSSRDIIEPQHFSKIKGLHVLSIMNCQNLNFDYISKLDSITHLELADYKHDIGDKISKLNSLESIDIYYSNYSKKDNSKFISPELTNIKTLKHLKISGWEGKSIIDMCKSIVGLEELELSFIEYLNQTDNFNQFINIISKKESLKSLVLNHIDMNNEMVKSICRLHQLENLKIKSFEANEITDQFLEMKNLKSLSISEFQVNTIPDWIGNLTNLENLELENMYDVETLPASLTNLTKLKRLSIYGIYPNELPEELNNLQLDQLKVRSSRGHTIRKMVLDILANKNTNIIYK